MGLLTLALYAAACLGPGVALLDALSPKPDARAPLQRLALAFVLGQAVVSQALLLLALAGRFSFIPISALLAASLLMLHGRGPMPSLGRPGADGAITGQPRSADTALIACAVIALALALGCAAYLSPPQGDAEAFYLVYPRIIAASGVLRPMPGPYEAFSSVGLLGEVHYAALIELAGVAEAKLFTWLVGVAAVALLVDIGALCGLGMAGRWVLAAIALSSSAFIQHFVDGKVDLYAAALGLASLSVGVRAGPNSPARQWLLVGLLLGLAFVAKFSSIVALGPGVALIAAWALRGVPGRRRAWCATLAAAGFVCGAAPHLIKNGVLFGAPLAPFIGVVPEGLVDQHWFDRETTRWIVLTYPLALIYGRYPMQAGNLSFLVIAFVPLLFLLGRPRNFLASPLIATSAAGVLGIAAWAALRPSMIAPRYILAAVLLLAIPAARAAAHVLAGEARPRWVSGGVVATILVALGAAAYIPAKPLWAAVSNGRAHLVECRGASMHCADLAWIRNHALPGERIWLSSYFGYWLRTDQLQCREHASERRAVEALASAPERWAAIHMRGFRYVAIDRREPLDRWMLDASRTPQWLALETLSEGQALTIVRINPAPHAPPAVEARCEKQTGGRWAVSGR